jgi:hypothetical protein
MVGYISKFRFAELCILTDEPNFSDIEVAEYDWSKSVYGNASKAVPKDAPEPLGKPITMTHYQDANLYHDIITGQSITAILHFLNKFPFDWYPRSKLQSKQLHMEVSTSQQGPVSTKSLIYKLHCDTSVFQSET